MFLLLVLGVSLLYAFLVSGIMYSQAQIQSQLPQKPTIAVKINSPSVGQEVPVGELNITGTSTDDATTDCKVYVDWNDQKPFQNVTATGPGGENDYSNWTFTYTKDYHLITNGTNELTSKLICYDNFNDSTKWNSVNIMGVVSAQNQTQQPLIVNNSTSSGNGPVKIASSPLRPQAEPPSVPEGASQLVPLKEPKEEDEREEFPEEEDTLNEVSGADPFKLPF
jgi:hypothetical protein